MKRTFLSASVVALIVSATTRSFGQASPEEIAEFSMPPPSGYVARKHFAYVGDYGYYTAPSSAVASTTAKASDYKYVRYTGVSGKRVFVYGAWGTTPIPPPEGDADACGHAHTSYGVWARWEFRILFFRRLSRWMSLGGGGMSGARNAQGKCVFSPDNPLAGLDPRFGWGDRFKSFDFRNVTYFKELVVGALSNTHGWGSCRNDSFPACHEPSYIIGYTLP